MTLTFFPLATLALLATLPPTRQVTLHFRAVVDSAPFACGQPYAGLGTTRATVTPTDFKLYVHDVRLVRADGREVPVALQQDGLWQNGGVALLDFGDGTGPCGNGTPETRDVVVGTVPDGRYTGVRFAVGVPFARNHADQTTAPSPLSLTRMFWSWNAGYKFARIDLRVGDAAESSAATTGAPAGRRDDMTPTAATRVQNWMIHLGSTGCTPTGRASTAPTACAHPNRPTIALARFDAERDAITLDLAALLRGADVTANQPQTASGCMSADNDADCAPLFAALGLPHGAHPAGTQSAFRVTRAGATAAAVQGAGQP